MAVLTPKTVPSNVQFCVCQYRRQEHTLSIDILVRYGGIEGAETVSYHRCAYASSGSEKG